MRAPAAEGAPPAASAEGAAAAPKVQDSEFVRPAPCADSASGPLLPPPPPRALPPYCSAPEFNFWGLDEYIKSIVFGGAWPASGPLPLVLGHPRPLTPLSRRAPLILPQGLTAS